MDYTLHQLRIFLKIAQTKSITKTAEALFLTQPAVSIQLRNFQNQFSIPLTEIVGRQLFVTDFGVEIAKIAQNIINEVEQIQYKTLEFQNVLAGKLKISIVSTGKYVMPFFLSDFLKKHSGVALSMDVTNKQKVIKSLEYNEVDFALISVLPKGINIESTILLENKLFLMGNNPINEDHSLSQKSIFNEIPLIYREEGSGTRHVMEKFFEKNDISTKKTMQLSTNEAVKQAVLAGLGYSVMPLIGCINELSDGQLNLIPVEGFPIKSDWRLIWLKEKPLSPVALAYLNYLNENKNRIIETNFSWINAY
jgi:DNA-binding transcriptional LysR family regulator